MTILTVLENEARGAALAEILKKIVPDAEILGFQSALTALAEAGIKP